MNSQKSSMSPNPDEPLCHHCKLENHDEGERFCSNDCEIEHWRTSTSFESEAFNGALNYALDEAGSDSDAMTFLRMWREGDWEGLAKDFPDYEKPEGI